MTETESPEDDQGFGSFLASFIEDRKGAIALTVILILVFSSCFLVNFFTYRLARNLEKYLVTPRDKYMGINYSTLEQTTIINSFASPQNHQAQSLFPEE